MNLLLIINNVNVKLSGISMNVNLKNTSSKILFKHNPLLIEYNEEYN